MPLAGTPRWKFGGPTDIVVVLASPRLQEVLLIQDSCSAPSTRHAPVRTASEEPTHRTEELP